MSELHLITTILAIANGVIPVLFGFVLWQLSRVFITRTEFDNYKKTAETDRYEIKASIRQMEQDVKEILGRIPRRER